MYRFLTIPFFPLNLGYFFIFDESLCLTTYTTITVDFHATWHIFGVNMSIVNGGEGFTHKALCIF